MRPGSPEDFPRLVELWRRNAREGRQDAVPSEARLRRGLEHFDWDARSRVLPGADGALEAAVLVTPRETPEGVMTTLYMAGPPAAVKELARWGLMLSRATGAAGSHVFVSKGHGEALEAAGFKNLRPWLRMDRPLDGPLPPDRPVDGYRVVDATSFSPTMLADVFNRSFADHWRFSPQTGDQLLAGRDPALEVVAVTERGEPAALTFGEVEAYVDDPRPQPVGLISHVGTTPSHRRRGLASRLVTEMLRRLRSAGARSASLYVDGLSPMRAYDVYRKLGFEVAFETEVWEA